MNYRELSEATFKMFYEFLGEIMNASVCQLSRNDKRVYSSTLTNNVRRQSFIIHHLTEGFDAATGRFAEVASVQTTSRLALETYLVFHHIFIDSKSEAEQDFKYFAWILDTLKRRAEKYHIENFEHLTNDPEGAKTMEHVKKAINANPMQQQEVIDLLKKNDFYLKLQNSNDQDRKMRYKKRLEHGWFPDDWTPLMRAAGMQYFIDNHIYEWLSSAAHPSFYIIECCTHARTYEEQRELCRFSKSLVMTLMAKLCLEYPIVFPQSQSVLDSNETKKRIAEEICRRIQNGQKISE